MLSFENYYNRFLEIQNDLYETFETVINCLNPGYSEKYIATQLENDLFKKGYKNFWYPTLVYIGQSTSIPISRRLHLPSEDRILKNNDIICLDVTPIDSTVWGNWCQTISFGSDSFFDTLCLNCFEITTNLCQYAKGECKTIGDLYSYFQQLISEKELFLLAPYNSLGHSIFQVPKNSKVEGMKINERIQINEDFFNIALEQINLLSIEPQLARINPIDGKTYSAKQQEIIYYSKNNTYEMD
jgi:hypothetical protein